MEDDGDDSWEDESSSSVSSEVKVKVMLMCRLSFQLCHKYKYYDCSLEFDRTKINGNLKVRHGWPSRGDFGELPNMLFQHHHPFVDHNGGSIHVLAVK